MTYEKIRLEIKDSVGVITFATPQKYNALSHRAYEEILDALDSIKENEEIGAVLFCGEGKAFCSGFDLGESAENTDPWPHWERFLHQREMMLKIYNFPKPTVAAVQGYCLGGGVEFTSLVDLIIAADNAKFGDPGLRYSNVPAPTLLWLAGTRRAKQYMLMAENFDAREALRIGYINRVVPLDELYDTAFHTAKRLAAMPMETMEVTKRLINKSLDGMGFKAYGDWGWDTFHIAKISPTKLGVEFDTIAKEKGMKEAFKWSNARYEE
ncbi:enoyl-CoA hydratase [Oscillibacter sp. PC13]|uniref:enoyl-CoA hydratase/isomerase family protein n=1 Tax=Oscillibacter sp. PC13 TaxID=1855299 RepID=UPI0008E361D4|nr:enoyl-CoA hydratase/isomerase family protein [Oscillibacter sp. PC13]SFQ00290.1 enoyl-CoA hydratase [Oscillibacter sp. PC13]